MRYYQIILEDFKTAAKKYIDSGISANEVANTLTKFRGISSKISDLNQKNIDWWAGNRTYAQLVDFITNTAGIPSGKQMKKTGVGRSHTIVENSDWLIVIPLDKDASCFHGRSTDWCTTKPLRSYFEQYFYDNEIVLIYCLNKNSGNKWAIAAHKDNLNNSEYFDVNDNSIKKDEFKSQTGLDPDEIISIAFGLEPQDKVNKSREYYHSVIDKIEKLLPSVVTGENNLEIEKLLLYTKNDYLIERYMTLVGFSDKYNINLQKIAVQQSGYAIEYIKNPSEAVQLSAVKRNGGAIKYIIDNGITPSEEIQLAAVQQKGDVIRYIENPSEEIQLAAVKQNGDAILYIENPSEEIQLAAVQKRGYAVKHIIDAGITPSEEVQLAAVQQDGRAIQYIKNPSEEVQLAAVQRNGSAIAYIKNPSEEIQLAAVQRSGSAILYIKNPSEAVQLAAVNQYGSAIQYIKNPSEAVQLAAVNQVGYAIGYIKNPSEENQLAAVNRNRDAISYIKNPYPSVIKLAKEMWAKEMGYSK